MIVAIHAVAATGAIVLGPLNLLRRRRDHAHRIIGRTWAAATVITCLSSFGIHPDGFSWLHGLAVFTLVSVTIGVVAIRRRNVVAHRANMTGSYVGTLIAFGFAVFLPDRLVARMAADDPMSLLGIVALVLAGCAAVAALALRSSRPTAPRRTADAPATPALVSPPRR